MKKIISLTMGFTLVLALILSLSACGAQLTVSYKDADKYTAGAAALTSAVSELEINWISGDIEIAYHEGTEIIIDESASRTLDEEEQLRYYLDGDTLRIQYAAKGTWSFGRLTKRLSVRLPQGTELSEIEIDSASADASLQGIKAEELKLESSSGGAVFEGGTFKKLSFDSVSGSLKIKESDIPVSLSVETVSGDADIKLATECADLELFTVSGDVSLSAPKVLDLECETTSGSVELSLGALGYDTVLDSISADITLELPKDAGFNLEFDTVSGKFESKIPTTNSSDRYLAGDGSAKIEIDTVSGNLSISAAE